MTKQRRVMLDDESRVVRKPPRATPEQIRNDWWLMVQGRIRAGKPIEPFPVTAPGSLWSLLHEAAGMERP